jgi:uncharacterized protein (TIGR02271 family)
MNSSDSTLPADSTLLRETERIVAEERAQKSRLGAMQDEDERIVLEEAEERLQVGVREVETGRVRVARTVETFDETIEVPLTRETVEVEHVAIGSFVDAVPTVRREGDVLVFPVVEEVLVVEKRLRLVEEVRVLQRATQETATETHTLRRTRVDTERLTGDAA